MNTTCYCSGRFWRLVLIILTVPFVLLWGELFTRLLLPQNLDSRKNFYAPDAEIGFIHKPHAVGYEKGREYNARYEINSLGLRDREYGIKKQGIFRVLLLGDSFSVSHGLQIEESLSRQMERALQSLAVLDGMSVKIEVVNGAAGGYSPYNYWKAYRRWAPILEPDVVMVGLSPDDYDSSNAELNYDIEDGATMATFRDGYKPQKVRGKSIRNIRKWLSWNSQFYILLRNFVYYNDLVGKISTWTSRKGAASSNQLKQFMVPQSKSMAEAWAQSFSYLENLHKETTAQNVALIVIPIPLKMEIIPEVYHHILSAGNLKDEEIDLNQPLLQISTFCKDRKITILDPRAALKIRQAEVACYFVYDDHWNSEGVRVAADDLAKQWRENALVPWGNVHQTSSEDPAKGVAQTRLPNK